MICVRAVAARRVTRKLRHIALPGDTTASDVPAFNSNLSEELIRCRVVRNVHERRRRPGDSLLRLCFANTPTDVRIKGRRALRHRRRDNVLVLRRD